LELLVISSAPLIHKEEKWFMYGPYQKEMKIWASHVDQIRFCCPIWKEDRKLLIDEITFPIEPTIELKEFDIQSLYKLPKAIWLSILNFFIILKAMKNADHIHLRCPGNIGLLASLAQIFYPKKKKTVKYAGNWDPKSKQPWSYRLQKRIVGNTFLTRNMQVLVYGEWPDQTKNIKPFFTATYSEQEKLPVVERDYSSEMQFLFIGTLSKGKQPLWAIQFVEGLYKKGFKVCLDMFGEGTEREQLTHYIKEKGLETIITLHGNQPKAVVKERLQVSHFLILPSKSEGWPKVVAEAMFWGCVPVVTPISCVSWMLGGGERGILVSDSPEKEAEKFTEMFSESGFKNMSKAGENWSRTYTLEYFETEISDLLKE